ncbi:MAG: septum formation initiator family protein [Defluviitaleaceae bacterium]|nr:septum formation initiator family protein [Defluviitaleaceae bacterium]
MKIVRISLSIFFTICIIFFVFIMYGQRSLYMVELERTRTLKEQIEIATEENKRLRFEIENQMTDEYIEMIARELGFVRNTETIFIPNN